MSSSPTSTRTADSRRHLCNRIHQHSTDRDFLEDLLPLPAPLQPLQHAVNGHEAVLGGLLRELVELLLNRLEVVVEAGELVVVKLHLDVGGLVLGSG